MPLSEPRPYSLTDRDDASKQEFWSCLALRETPGIGMRRIAALLSYFGSAYDAVRSPESWPDAGVPGLHADSFKQEAWRQKARLEWDAAKNSPCGILLWSDPEYPAWLRSIADPPPFLYFFGDIVLLEGIAVAVVGMRSCSEEGLKATIHIARGLAEAGVTIVSGMAKGIDRAAHLAGLEGPGSSIGVLGAGIDVQYPPANRDLYALMHQKGLLVSEYPPAFGVDARSFPVRNRIISGISRAVVVVEAALRSGSLNTANHALDQNRDLMAVPGPVTAPSAKGCQELVRRGAKPVFCADDVLRELLPFLREHVRGEVIARDQERFQYPRVEKKSAPPVETSRDGLLPWKPGTPGRMAQKRTRVGAPGKPGAEPRRDKEIERHTTVVAEAPDAASVGLTGLEAAVYEQIRSGPIHIDDICRALGQNAKTVSRIAAILEIQGRVQRLPGMRYSIH